LNQGVHPGGYNGQDAYTGHLVTHSLSADGFDASEDGTGRGTPLVPVAFRACGQDGFTPSGICPPIASTDGGGAGVPTIDCKASGRNGFGIGEQSPTLRSMGHKDTHQNAGGQVAVMTLAIRGRDGEPSLEVRDDGTANAVLTPNGGRAGIGVGAVAIGIDEEQNATLDGMGCLKARREGGGFEGTVMTPTMAVRRLTPRECERLQGVPDDYTLVERNGKAMADGPRYKMLGNGFAVPVVRWIGERLAKAVK